MLVGRRAERAELERVLEGARRGQGGALLVVGEAGIGKSALLDDVAASADGFTLLHARGVEAESELAFFGVGELLQPVICLLDAVPRQQAAAVASALAVGPPVRADRFATYNGVLGLLAAAAEAAPVLAIIDDAQWVDH